MFTGISQEFNRLNIAEPYRLPDLRDSQRILVVSDYGGEHKAAPFQTISVLVAGLDACVRWDAERRLVRNLYLGSKRRMSFKQLSDRVRQRALLPFLSAADSIPGLCLLVGIDKAIDTLFDGAAALRDDDPLSAIRRGWPKGTLEKALRVAHLTSLLLGGLSSPGQEVIWITDQDEIAANDRRLDELTVLIGGVIGAYVPFSLGRLRVGTTKSDDGSLTIEDAASVADLVAGAFADIFRAKKELGIQWSQTVPIWWKRGDFQDKSGLISTWFGQDSQPLRRVALTVELKRESGRHLVSWLALHDPRLRAKPAP
jgi:hypothetical protein